LAKVGTGHWPVLVEKNNLVIAKSDSDEAIPRGMRRTRDCFTSFVMTKKKGGGKMG